MSGREKQWLRGPRSYYEWLAARMDEHERRAVAAASTHVPHGQAGTVLRTVGQIRAACRRMLEWDDRRHRTARLMLGLATVNCAKVEAIGDGPTITCFNREK